MLTIGEMCYIRLSLLIILPAIVVGIACPAWPVAADTAAGPAEDTAVFSPDNAVSCSCGEEAIFTDIETIAADAHPWDGMYWNSKQRIGLGLAACNRCFLRPGEFRDVISEDTALAGYFNGLLPDLLAVLIDGDTANEEFGYVLIETDSRITITVYSNSELANEQGWYAMVHTPPVDIYEILAQYARLYRYPLRP